MQILVWFFSFIASIWIVSLVRYALFNLWAYQFFLVIRQENYVAPFISMILSFFACVNAVGILYSVTENSFLEFSYFMVIILVIIFGVGGGSNAYKISTSSLEDVSNDYGEIPKEIVYWTAVLTLAGNLLGTMVGFAAVYVESMDDCGVFCFFGEISIF